MIDGEVVAWWNEHMLHTPEVMRVMSSKQQTDEMTEVLRRLPPEFRATMVDRAMVPYLSRDVVDAVVQEVPPERLLAGRSQEQQFAAMPLEILRGLSKEYVETLPSSVCEIIRQRLQPH